MRVTDVIRYLFGNEEAIFEIASSRNALWLGLLFVLSAGFAREYDGEDLLHEPWHLLIPLGASLGSSFILYCSIWIVAFCRGAKNSFWSGYGVFLTLFWMTAPLAWLYAVPVERFLSAADSVRANLALLGIVSVWRVALITRVVSVLYCCKPQAAFVVVMLFADAVLLTILELTPLPIFSVMGGIRLTEAEEVLLATTFFVRLGGFLSMPIWVISALSVAALGTRDVGAWQLVQADDQPIDATEPRTVSLRLWMVAGSALLIWVVILPFTQAEQRNRRYVETTFGRGEIESGLMYMSQRQPGDFPPHWDPPPRISYGQDKPNIWEIIRINRQSGTSPWVRSIFVEKVVLQSYAGHFGPDRFIEFTEMSEDDLREYITLLRKVPVGRERAAVRRHEIERILERADDPASPDPHISETRRHLLQELLEFGRSDDDL